MASCVINVVGLWTKGEDPGKHIAWVRACSDALKGAGTGQAYLNFQADTGEDQVRSAYSSNAYARLSALKGKYDPNNLFRVNQNIKPAALARAG